MSAGPIEACGSTVYVVEGVLLPASLLAIPETTPEQAMAMLGGGMSIQGGAPTPAPAPAPEMAM